MNRTILTLSALAVLSASAFYVVTGRPSAETASSEVSVTNVEGMVESVNVKRGTFTMRVDERRKTLKFNLATLYFLDGELATRDLVLVVGNEVEVTFSDGLAERVETYVADRS